MTTNEIIERLKADMSEYQKAAEAYDTAGRKLKDDLRAADLFLSSTNTDIVNAFYKYLTEAQLQASRENAGR